MNKEDAVFEGLSHKTRRKIIEYIGLKGKATYSELLEATGVETGVLNYHLNKIKKLVEKNGGEYKLTPLGWKAYNLLLYFRRGEKSGVEVKGFLEALRDIYFFPHRVYASPLEYKVYTIIPAVLFYLLEAIRLKNLLIPLITTFTPFLTINIATFIIYGITPQNLRKDLIAYPVTLVPLAFISATIQILYTLHISLGFLVVGFLAIYIAYTMLYVNKIYNLDLSKSMLISVINTLTLIYIYSKIGNILPVNILEYI